MPIKFLVLGGVFWVGGGGGSADFIFMGARIFLNSIAEGGIAPGYRANIAEIPLLGGGGYRTSTSRMLPTREMLIKGGGGIAPNWPC